MIINMTALVVYLMGTIITLIFIHVIKKKRLDDEILELRQKVAAQSHQIYKLQPRGCPSSRHSEHVGRSTIYGSYVRGEDESEDSGITMALGSLWDHLEDFVDVETVGYKTNAKIDIYEQ